MSYFRAIFWLMMFALAMGGAAGVARLTHDLIVWGGRAIM